MREKVRAKKEALKKKLRNNKTKGGDEDDAYNYKYYFCCGVSMYYEYFFVCRLSNHSIQVCASPYRLLRNAQSLTKH